MECVNVLNEISHFYYKHSITVIHKSVCQRPKRALSISTWLQAFESCLHEVCVNALNGLSPFLQYLPRNWINTGFTGSFLQVFIWIFWNQWFSTIFGMWTIYSYFQLIADITYINIILYLYKKRNPFPCFLAFVRSLFSFQCFLHPFSYRILNYADIPFCSVQYGSGGFSFRLQSEYSLPLFLCLLFSTYSIPEFYRCQAFPLLVWE